mgnify:CR=1 FL=1
MINGVDVVGTVLLVVVVFVIGVFFGIAFMSMGDSPEEEKKEGVLDDNKGNE